MLKALEIRSSEMNILGGGIFAERLLIENLAYSVGVNRVGTDGNQVPYVGHSAVFDFKGKELIHLGEKDKVEVIELDKTELENYRSKFPAWIDADDFTIDRRVQE